MLENVSKIKQFDENFTAVYADYFFNRSVYKTAFIRKLDLGFGRLQRFCVFVTIRNILRKKHQFCAVFHMDLYQKRTVTMEWLCGWPERLVGASCGSLPVCRKAYDLQAKQILSPASVRSLSR